MELQEFILPISFTKLSSFNIKTINAIRNVQPEQI